MPLQFIDTHTHINLQAFADDSTEVMQRALSQGVAVVNVGTQIDTSKRAVEILDQFSENVYAVVGLHPSHAHTSNFIDEQEVQMKTVEQGFNSQLYEPFMANPRVVGIGECGLDYYRLPDDQEIKEQIKQVQRSEFQKQIDFAVKYNRALCIHCRPTAETMDAYEEMIEILTNSIQQHPNLRFEIHSFTGTSDIAKQFVALGAFIALNGIITFDKTNRSQEVVQAVPLENLILETDAPYLAPKSKRGQRNEPSFLPEIAELIAVWKNCTVTQVSEQTTINAKKLFALN